MTDGLPKQVSKINIMNYNSKLIYKKKDRNIE